MKNLIKTLAVMTITSCAKLDRDDYMERISRVQNELTNIRVLQVEELVKTEAVTQQYSVALNSINKMLASGELNPAGDITFLESKDPLFRPLSRIMSDAGFRLYFVSGDSSRRILSFYLPKEQRSYLDPRDWLGAPLEEVPLPERIKVSLRYAYELAAQLPNTVFHYMWEWKRPDGSLCWHTRVSASEAGEIVAGVTPAEDPETLMEHNFNQSTNLAPGYDLLISENGCMQGIFSEDSVVRVPLVDLQWNSID